MGAVHVLHVLQQHLDGQDLRQRVKTCRIRSWQQEPCSNTPGSVSAAELCNRSLPHTCALTHVLTPQRHGGHPAEQRFLMFHPPRGGFTQSVFRAAELAHRMLAGFDGRSSSNLVRKQQNCTRTWRLNFL